MTRTPRRTPFLSFSGLEMRSVTSAFDIPNADSDATQKPWYDYAPLCGMFVIIF